MKLIWAWIGRRFPHGRLLGLKWHFGATGYLWVRHRGKNVFSRYGWEVR